MTTVHLGEFHNVVGAQMNNYGISIWDNQDMEFFIELISAEPLTAQGEFGSPPIEGGFQYVEGLRIHSVQKVEIKQHNIFDDFEVRHLHVIAQGGADLKWDLFIPRGNT